MTSCSGGSNRRPGDRRGQLSLSAIEATIGVVLVLGVTVGFALGVPTPTGRQAQLDAYAQDTATVLADEPPRHGGATRLAEIVRSEDSFERENEALERRVDRILPDNLMFRVTTPHGTVGYQVPNGVAVGSATVTTVHGDVRIEVWYA